MARRDEPDEFGAFYEATYQRAYRTALAIVGQPALAADVTQDAYIAAYRRRGTFRNEAPREHWLLRIVVNTAISSTRRQRVRWTGPLTFGLAGRSDDIARAADRLSVLAALQVLPPQQRAAIVLRFYDGHDYEAIARILETNVGTVGSWLSRGLTRLGREMTTDSTDFDRRHAEGTDVF